MNIRWKIAQHFELKWWKRYLKGRNKQQYLENKRKYWESLYALISDQVPIQAKDTILDLGCGPAGICLLFNENDLTAVDPLLDEYEKNLGIFSKTDYPNTRFINCDIEHYSSKERFDVVFCMNAINHVSDIENAYMKLAACAKVGGRIVVSIDAHNHRIFKFLFRLLQGDILHPHQYDQGEYEIFLQKNQCRILQTKLVKKGFFFSHYIMVAEKLS